MKIYLVKRKEGQWTIQSPSNKRILRSLKTQSEAVKIAKEMAKNQKALLKTYGLDGKLKKTTDYSDKPDKKAKKTTGKKKVNTKKTTSSLKKKKGAIPTSLINSISKLKKQEGQYYSKSKPPSISKITLLEKKLKMKIPVHYRYFLSEIGHYEEIGNINIFPVGKIHSATKEYRKSHAVKEDHIVIAYDNGHPFCVTPKGRIVHESNGLFKAEKPMSLAVWIKSELLEK